MNNTRFTFLRHGQPEQHDCLLGRTNPCLTERGWQQMHLSSQDIKFDRIISSPLRRCSQFAHHLADKTSKPLQVCPDWQELDFGLWDGLPLSQLWQDTHCGYPQFWQQPFVITPPQGESSLELLTRATAQIKLISQNHQGEHILIVTHSGVIRILMHWLFSPADLADDIKVLGHQTTGNAHLSHLVVAHAARLEIQTYIDEDNKLWPQLTGLHNPK
ncbi:histidine phosphatase family protein [Shewanella sp. KT0246]|uniref:histidine phosphatase family protein n=1 Tax=Shewanella sp. KT0246 TaxID=2815912 RepID=UPI001BBAEED4|nr:histidine phosphatase family protein [Shewanella sp. KT0246]GIU48492.1 hypothetical protein TUM4249_03920 [Shewanella sp. KT0246]